MPSFEQRENSQPLLTVKEVAHLLQVSPRTIRQWADEGAIRALRCGRQWRFRLTDLKDFLARAEAECPVIQK